MKSSFGRIIKFFWTIQNSAKKFFRGTKFEHSAVLATLVISLTFFFSAVALADEIVHTKTFPDGMFNNNASGTGVGDGYAPIPYTSTLGDRIYYINHHEGPGSSVFGCYDKDTGIKCVDSGITWNQKLPDGADDLVEGFAYFSSTANSIEEPLIIGSKLYYAVTRFTGNNFSGYTPQDWGLGCYNLDSLTECGWVELSGNPNNRKVRVGIEGPFLVAGNLYLLDVDMKLYCVDPATNTECTISDVDLSQPATGNLPTITQDDTVYAGRIGGEVIAPQLFLTVNYHGSTENPNINVKKILCINTTNLTMCNNWTGAVDFADRENNLNVSNYIYYNQSLAPEAICNRNRTNQSCIDISNGLPKPLLTDVAQNNSLGGIFGFGLGKEVKINNKTYFPDWAKTDIYCFDWANGIQCPTFPKQSPVSNPQNYGLAVDQAGCIWAYGHNKKLWSLDQITETFPCRSGTFVGSVPKSCPSSNWTTFIVSDITEADYATLVVRIWDGSSWVDYDLLNGNSTTIDLSTSQFAGMDPLEYEVDVTFADGVSEYTTTPIINISNNMVPGQDCSYDLEIEKTANDNDVPWTIGGPGQTFTLEVANPGIDLPMGNIITVTDTLPNGLVATSASGSGWVCDPPPPAGQEVICTTTLQTDFTSSTQLPGITIDVNVTGLPEGDAFVNCAQVYITGAAGNLILLDEDCVAIPSPPLFDLEITKELVGDCLEDSACYYEITITNNGPGPFSGPINVEDTWDNTDVTFLMSGYPWNCTGGPGSPVTCDYMGPSVNLGVGDSISFLIAVNIPDDMAGETLENCAEIKWPGTGGINSDTNPENDKSCVETIIYECPPDYDLTIEKAALGSPWTAGDQNAGGYYELVVTNNGNAINPGVGVVVTDTLPNGLNLTGVDGSPDWDCEILPPPNNPNAFTCTYIGGIIQEGQVLTTITVYAWASDDGEFKNCATVDLIGETDINPSDNTDCAIIIVDPTYDVTIEKLSEGSGDNGQWIAGEAGTFTLIITNLDGPLLSPFSLVVTDNNFPPGFDVTGAAGQNWDCSGSDFVNDVVVCTYIGPDVPGGSVLIGPITIDAIAGNAGAYENCARVDLDGYDETDLVNNEDCVRVIVDPPEGFDLEVLKELIGECKEGSVCSFKITITNNGPATFSGAIAIDDTWDLSLVSFLMGSNPWNCSGSTMAAECFGPTVTLDPNDPLNNSVSFFIGLTVPAGLDEEGFVNCAAINWDNMPGFVDGDEDPTNDEFCIEVDPCECEDEEHNLAIWKISLGSDGFNGDWVAGETGIFVLNITNIGASIEAGQGETVFVVDNLPPGFTLDTPYPVNNFWDCSNSTPTQLSCQYIGPDVVAAPPNTLMNQITFHATPGEPGEFENCAEVALDGATDVAMGNNKKCIPIVVLEATPDPRHDIMLEKTSKGNQWTPGQTGAFYLDVTNLGDPIVAPVTVNVSDSLPPGFTFVPPATGGPYWNCTGLSCTYNGPPIGTNGQFPQIEIIVTAPMRPGVYENCAAAELMNAIDIDNSNNTDCIKIEVVEPHEPRHDLAIEKTSTGGAVGFGGWFPGAPGTFTLQVTNLGPALNPPGTIIVTDDDFPPWFNIISAGGNGWNCIWPNNELTCTYVGGPVGPNQPLPPIVVTAEPGATGEFVNCAEVALNGATDVNLSNNESCIPVVVGIPSGSGYDVAIDKVSDGSNWPAGGTAYFVLRPTNIGTTITPPGTTVVVTDPVPAGFTISSVSGGPYWNCLFSTGTPANLSCTYSGPPVGSGQPFPPIQLFVNVPERPGEYRNCAGVELTGATDTDLSNNNSCTVVTVDVGKSFEVARGGVVIVGVFTELTGTTVVNTGLVGEVGTVTVIGVDGGPVDSDDVDIREQDGNITINVSTGTQVGAITIEGRDGTITLKADGARPTGPPGMTWPKDGAVNVQSGILNETFSVPSTITEGGRPVEDYEVSFGDTQVEVVAIRNGEIAVTGKGIPMQNSGEAAISIAVKDGPRVSGQIPAWSYQLSAQAVTRLNTWAPIFFQCSGLPNREPITIRFTPEPWQKIEPREISLACGEASSRIQIGQYQTSREGPQSLPAVIDRSPGR